MSISRWAWSAGQDATGPDGRPRTIHLEQRRATRDGVVCEATLACPSCDAPIAAGPEGLSLAARLSCPYCGHRAPVRDCLSLARPTRPARVVVRVRVPARTARSA